MQIQMSARGTELTQTIKDYVQEKVGKLETFASDIQKAEVVLEAHDINDVDKRQVVEIRLWVSGLKFITAKEAGRDLYAALDLVVEEVKRQLQKHKSMHTDEKRRQAGKDKRMLQKNSGLQSSSDAGIAEFEQ
ncbi:MAG: ribosome-associated translation inhibitor RaiA [Candidatus Margulisiibacteriota bacterium]